MLYGRGTLNRARGRGGRTRAPAWSAVRPWVAGGIVIAALVFILAAAPWVFRHAVFVTNKTFVLRTFDIEGGETLTPGLMEELLGSGDQPLKAGTPLFAVNIAAKQREFLQAAHNVRDIRITRVLPDTLKVRIVERRPLVRVERIGGLVADSEGAIFVRYRGIAELPLLTGLEGFDTALGGRLSGMALAGIRLVAFLENQPFRIPVVSIDAAHPDHLTLTLVDQKQVALSWPGMLDPNGGSREHLRRTLAELSRAMNTAGGRSRRYWNATVPGRIAAE